MYLGRRREPDRAGHVLRAAAKPAFLSATGDDRRDVGLARQREEADAARPVELVTRHRDRVHAHQVEVEVDLGVALHEVEVHVRVRADPPHDLDELVDVGERAELVVPVQDRHHSHVRAERVEQRLGLEDPVRPRRDLEELVSLAEGRIEGEHCRVIRGSAQNAPRGPRPGGTDDAEEVRLGATRREHEPRRADAPAQELARILEQPLRGLAETVGRRRVAERHAHRLGDGVDDLRQRGSRRRVVEVDAAALVHRAERSGTAEGVQQVPLRRPARSGAQPFEDRFSFTAAAGSSTRNVNDSVRYSSTSSRSWCT